MKRDIDFLNKVRVLATINNMSATAKALKIPVYTLKASLLSAAIKLGEIPPQFAKKRATNKVSKKICSKFSRVVKIQKAKAHIKLCLKKSKSKFDN